MSGRYLAAFVILSLVALSAGTGRAQDYDFTYTCDDWGDVIDPDSLGLFYTYLTNTGAQPDSYLVVLDKQLPVPWQALLLSIAIYVALPLIAGYFSRKFLISYKGESWFRNKFLHLLTPVTIIALLVTLVLLFSFKGEVILANPMTILWIAIPLFVQTNLIFWLGYGLARLFKLKYQDAAPAARHPEPRVRPRQDRGGPLGDRQAEDSPHRHREQHLPHPAVARSHP